MLVPLPTLILPPLLPPWIVLAIRATVEPHLFTIAPILDDCCSCSWSSGRRLHEVLMVGAPRLRDEDPEGGEEARGARGWGGARGCGIGGPWPRRVWGGQPGGLALGGSGHYVHLLLFVPLLLYISLSPMFSLPPWPFLVAHAVAHPHFYHHCNLPEQPSLSPGFVCSCYVLVPLLTLILPTLQLPPWSFIAARGLASLILSPWWLPP